MAETSGQKRLIRKLIEGEKLVRHSSQIVGRNRIVYYILTSGTTVKDETVRPLLSRGILVRGKSDNYTGYGYQTRITEFKLGEEYIKI